MTDWNRLTPEQQALAEQSFVALSARSTLRAQAGGDQRPRLDLGTLYAYATNPDTVLPAGAEEQLQSDPDLRETLHRLLTKSAAGHLPRAAAASSGTLLVREADGFRIRLRESRADASQVYVLIELPQPGMPAPRALFIYGEDGGCRKFPLPADQDGVVQLLTAADSPLVSGLQDHRTEIFLR